MAMQALVRRIDGFLGGEEGPVTTIVQLQKLWVRIHYTNYPEQYRHFVKMIETTYPVGSFSELRPEPKVECIVDHDKQTVQVNAIHLIQDNAIWKTCRCHEPEKCWTEEIKRLWYWYIFTKGKGWELNVYNVLKGVFYVFPNEADCAIYEKNWINFLLKPESPTTTSRT
jgi:hypothetical protein